MERNKKRVGKQIAVLKESERVRGGAGGFLCGVRGE